MSISKKLIRVLSYINLFGQDYGEAIVEMDAPDDAGGKSLDFKELGEQIGIEWDSVDFSPEALSKGYKVELEHGSRNPSTNVTDNDPVLTAKIAWAHLKEFGDYYDRLEKMEEEGKAVRIKE